MHNYYEKIKELYYKCGKYRWIIISTLFFLFFKISYLRTVVILQPAYKIVRWFFSFAVILLFILSKKKLSKLSIILLLSQLWSIINFLINNNGTSLFEMIKSVASTVTVCLLVELFISDKHQLLNGLLLCYEISIYPEIVSLLMYPDGVNTIWVNYLGVYNIIPLYAIPALIVSTLCIEENNNKIRALLLFAGSIFCIYISHGTTAKLAISLFIIFVAMYLLIKKKLKIKINYSLIFIFILLVNIFLVFIYPTLDLDSINKFTMNVFNRRSTFTSRTIIWESAINEIKNRAVTGYGFGKAVPYEGEFVMPHNLMLNIILTDGIIGLGFIIALFFNFSHKYDSLIVNKYIILIEGLLTALCVVMLMESYNDIYLFYYILILLYNCKIKDY